MEELKRSNIRYICFRLKTESEGGPKASQTDTGVMSHVAEVKEHMEPQDGFGGWEKFGVTWDVDQISPWVVVRRKTSLETEWNKVVAKNARELPQASQGFVQEVVQGSVPEVAPKKKPRKRH